VERAERISVSAIGTKVLQEGQKFCKRDKSSARGTKALQEGQKLCKRDKSSARATNVVTRVDRGPQGDRTPFPTLPSLSAIRAGERPPRVTPTASRAASTGSAITQGRARARAGASPGGTSSAALPDTVSGIAPAMVAISGTQPSCARRHTRAFRRGKRASGEARGVRRQCAGRRHARRICGASVAVVERGLPHSPRTSRVGELRKGFYRRTGMGCRRLRSQATTLRACLEVFWSGSMLHRSMTIRCCIAQ